MKYMGSKARHVNEILPIMLKYRSNNQTWVEPFVGGANVIEHVDGKRIGADIHPYLIALWKGVSKGWMPPDHFTEEDYHHVKKHKDIDPVLAGYVGFAYSYGGKWFGGWCRDSQGKRDYVNEANKNAQKQFPKLQGVEFILASYTELDIPKNSLIYCDPPYKGTTKYSTDFDHDNFYEWCRKMVRIGHTVFISEYDMPEDFEIVWEKHVNSSLTKNTGG